MKATIYNQNGKEAGTIDIPKVLSDAQFNADLIHQVVVSQQSNKRTPVAHTKDRGAVRGGGKKPWRQKGTGRARHGSNRSPIWVGGGVTHGPLKEKNYSKKINKKMKNAALVSIFAQKLKDGEILFVESLSFDAPKTKDASSVLTSLSTIKGFELLLKKKNALTLALSSRDKNIEKSFQNFKAVLVDEVRNLNPVTLLNYKYLILTSPQESIDQLVGRLSLKS